MSADSYHPAFHKRGSSTNIKHLSGVTIMNPEAYLATIQDASPAELPPKMERESNRTSYASTTKSQIRQSNYQFMEMLQSIQEELSLHRSIMTDIQSRISKLEQPAPLEFKVNSPLATYESRYPPSRKTSNVGQECYSSWTTRPSPAPLLQTTTIESSARSGSGYLRTPRRFSGFDFNFDSLKQTLDTPPRTPDPGEASTSAIEADGLILASEIDQGPEVDTPSRQAETINRHIATFGGALTSHTIPSNPPQSPISELPSESWEHYQEESDIVEHVIEFDMIHVPRPPKLQSPPRSSRSKPLSSTPTSREEYITALPEVPLSLSATSSGMQKGGQPCQRGIKSLILCSAGLKRKVLRRESANGWER